jgi:plasmid stabilization system protein ParE
MNASFVVRPEAEIDMAIAKSWYDEQRMGLGDEFLTALEETFERIRDWPDGYAIEYRNVRAAPLHRFPYIIFYRLLSQSIQVLAVMHARRDSREWKSRIGR